MKDPNDTKDMLDSFDEDDTFEAMNAKLMPILGNQAAIA